MSTHLEPPQSEEELMSRSLKLVGLTIGQLAEQCAVQVPDDPLHAKGFMGSLIERALGCSAGNRALPDFVSLGIELKTLPINEVLHPAETTFVTSISLSSIHREQWETSSCYLKLKRILWVPFESSLAIPLGHRRIGQGFLWSPSSEDLSILKQDWSMLTGMITLGQLEHLSAKLGEYLQIRPKAASGKVLRAAFGVEGQSIKTLPLGFYLRKSFTTMIWKRQQNLLKALLN